MKMMAAAYQPGLDLLPDHAGTSENDVRTQVWGVLSTLYPKNDLMERRRETRYPFPYLVHLTPVETDDLTPCGERLVVVGKHVSQQGLGFYHPQPIAYRRMIASLESSNGQWFGFLIDLTWCRFTKHGWYESGGKFLQAVLSPLSHDAQP